MTKQHRHSIQSQRYLLTLGQAEQAGAYQSRISQLQHNRVNRLFEKVLTQFSREGKVFQFDQVALDLGTIHPANFENELMYRLEEQLTHFLQSHISADGTVVNGQYIDLFERQLELLAYFLANGNLPWSASRTEKPEDIFRELLRQQHPELLHLLKKQAVSENVRKRMVLQFTDETLAEIIRLATRQEGEYMLDFRIKLLSRQQKSNVPESNPGHFNQAVWEVILAYVFVETRSYYNKKYFLRYVIRQIARHYNYSYAVLLQFMATELKSRSRAGQAVKEFSQIIQSLHNETDQDANTEVNLTSDAAENIPGSGILLPALAYFLTHGSFENSLFHLSAAQLNGQIAQWIQADQPAAKVFFTELMATEKLSEVLRHLSRLESKTLQLIFEIIEFKPFKIRVLEFNKVLNCIAETVGIPVGLSRELHRQQYHLMLTAWSSGIRDTGGWIDFLLFSQPAFAQLRQVELAQLHTAMADAFPKAIQQSLWLQSAVTRPPEKDQSAFAQTGIWLQGWAELLQSRQENQGDAEIFQKFLLQGACRLAAIWQKSEKQLLTLLLQWLSRQPNTTQLQSLVETVILSVGNTAQHLQPNTANVTQGITGLPENQLRQYMDQLLNALETRQSDPAYAKVLTAHLSAWSKTHKLPVHILISQLIGQLSEWRQGVSGQANEILISFLRRLPSVTQQQDHARNYARDLIRYYAATGNLPWWSGSVNNRRLNQYFIQFCDDLPAEAVQFLNQNPSRKNLFGVLQEPSWLKLVATLQMPFDTDILQIFFRLESLLAKELKMLYPGLSGQLYEARYVLLNRVLKQGSHLRRDEWIPVFIEEMSRQSGLAAIDLLQLVAQRLHQDRPQGIRRIIDKQLRKLQIVQETPEHPNESHEERHPFYKFLFEPGTAGSNQPRLDQEKLFSYLSESAASKAISLPEKFKTHTIRKNMLEKLSRQNVVKLAALNFSETDEKALNAAVKMLQHLQKYMTLTQFDNVWHHFFDAVFLKIALDKQSPWKTADWSWMISQSVEAVLYKDKATTILNQLVNADTVRKAQPVEWKILQNIRKTVQTVTVPKPQQSAQASQHPGTEHIADFTPGDALFVDGAGVVLLGPYIPLLFERLQLTEGAEFRNETCRAQAIHLLYFAACGLTDPAEHELALYKILCGLDVAAPIAKDAGITDAQKGIVEELLTYVISQWEALKNTSPEGLRGTFLVRSGKLICEEEFDRIIVEHKAFDILLTKVPWSFSQLKFRWMSKLLTVEWMQ